MRISDWSSDVCSSDLNLLDPSHVSWVHQGSFGNAAMIGEPLKTQVNDDGVVVSRWMRNVEVAPFYAKFVKFAGHCDRKQHYEVRVPSHALIKAVRSEEHTSELQSLMRISYAAFGLKKKKQALTSY